MVTTRRAGKVARRAEIVPKTTRTSYTSESDNGESDTGESDTGDSDTGEPIAVNIAGKSEFDSVFPRVRGRRPNKNGISSDENGEDGIGSDEFESGARGRPFNKDVVTSDEDGVNFDEDGSNSDEDGINSSEDGVNSKGYDTDSKTHITQGELYRYLDAFFKGRRHRRGRGSRDY